MKRTSSPSLVHRVRSRFKALPPSAEHQFAHLPEPLPTDRILFFAPHPDDEALAAGGYLRKAVQAGAVVRIVLVTDGNKRGLKDIRYAEFATVLKDLGLDPEADVQKLEYPNGRLIKEDVVRLTAQFHLLIDEFCPTSVISPHPADLHREHVLIAHLVAAHHAMTPDYVLLQYLVHYPPNFPWPRSYSPKAPLLPPTDLTLRNEVWYVYPLTEDQVMKKKALVELYASQMKTPILRSLMYGLIRRTELFSVYPKA